MYCMGYVGRQRACSCFSQGSQFEVTYYNDQKPVARRRPEEGMAHKGPPVLLMQSEAKMFTKRAFRSREIASFASQVDGTNGDVRLHKVGGRASSATDISPRRTKDDWIKEGARTQNGRIRESERRAQPQQRFA